jgi:hypothetical protein
VVGDAPLPAVVSSLLFHVSVPLGYTPETSPKLTISLAPLQRATSLTHVQYLHKNRYRFYEFIWKLSKKYDG